MLTKTAYLAYNQCSKQLWLDAYRPEFSATPDPAALRRLRAGQQVDQLAREQFPNGRLIPYRPHPEEMSPLTRRRLRKEPKRCFKQRLPLRICW